MVDFTWMRKIRVLLWCTRESYPDGSPQGLAGRSPSSMARNAKHISAHAPRSLEFLMFMLRGFFTHLSSFFGARLPLWGGWAHNKKRGPDRAIPDSTLTCHPATGKVPIMQKCPAGFPSRERRGR